jgi:hypothetical protein
MTEPPRIFFLTTKPFRTDRVFSIWRKRGITFSF